MRELKTPQQLIMEGYTAEGAVVFLREFIQEEKDKQFNLLMTCHPDELPIRRAVYQYIDSIESLLINKVQTGINHAREQFG